MIREEKGTVQELAVTLVMILAMCSLIKGFMLSAEIIGTKIHVDNIARTYILRMETKGSLCASDESELMEELKGLGITEISLGNTTRGQSAYGDLIALEIAGKIDGKYEFVQKKTSTAKH